MSIFKVSNKYVGEMLEKSTLRFHNKGELLEVNCTLPNGYVFSVGSTEKTKEKREENCMKLIRKTIKELESYAWYITRKDAEEWQC